MKASELIKLLTAAIDFDGDQEVITEEYSITELEVEYIEQEESSDRNEKEFYKVFKLS